MATRTSPPKGLLVAGVVALLVGLGGCGGGLYGCTSFVAKLIAVIESSEPVPFAEAYRFTAEVENAWVLTSAEANCEATDATGSAVALSEPPEGVDQSYTVGDDGYDAAYAFDTVVGRGYEVICNGNAPAGEFLVVPLPGGLSNLKVGVGATVGGGALMVAGVGLTIAGIVQRSRWRRNGGAAGAVVPTSVGAPPPVPPPGPPTAPPSVPPAASPTVPPTGPPTVPPAGPPAAPPTGPTDQ